MNTQTNISYEIKDSNYGTMAYVHTPEGDFTLKISYYNGLNGRREHKVTGNYPRDKYSISYEQGKLFILEIDNGDYKEGQKVNHKAFGEGIIKEVLENTITIEFNGASRCLAKKLASNFLTK
jgi:hypothetical protein